MSAFMILVVLLGLGWCSGMRQIELEAKTDPPCPCKRCWYVGEAPLDAPICTNSIWRALGAGSDAKGKFMMAAVAGVGLLFWYLMRKKLKA